MSKNLIALQNKFLGQGQTIYDALTRLHDAQGFVSDDDILRLAREHSLPPAHVRSTAKFYEELRQTTPAKHTIKICNGEACRASGPCVGRLSKSSYGAAADDHGSTDGRVGNSSNYGGCKSLESALCAEFDVELGDTNAQGVRVEHVACLGYCGLGPNAMIDGVPVSCAAPGSVEKIVAYAKHGKSHGLTEPTNPVYMPNGEAPYTQGVSYSPPSQGGAGGGLDAQFDSAHKNAARPTLPQPLPKREGSQDTPAASTSADRKPCVLMRHFDREVSTVAKAKAAGIYKTLEKAVTTMSPQQVIDVVKASKLRGRGGAGFPAGIKWQTVADSPSEAPGRAGQKFIVVNFDEGDAGSYIDKELVERDPHTQLEGILLAAYACGAHEAYIYTRMEYPRAQRIVAAAIEDARAAGLIGAPLFGSKFQCDIKQVRGMGAYICGEETSLLRSIEGVPALVSIRPPFPAQKGLWGCPTAVNNVETIHNIPWIIQHGGEAYAKLGYEKSRGTKAISLNSRVKKPGMYEVEFGVTLREIIFDIAGGMAEGHTFKGVQIGGPLGGILPESCLDTPLDIEAVAAKNGIVGHAGIVVYSQADDLVEICRGLMEFCAIESCGKCFPCRIGSVRGTELFDQMMETGVTDKRLDLLKDLCEAMKLGSLCALGGLIPLPIECLMQYFPEELERYRQVAV